MKLFVFGLGYSALALSRLLRDEGWSIAGTARSAERCAALQHDGIEAIPFDGTAQSPAVASALGTASHVLASVPPDAGGDPVIRCHGADLAAAAPQWIGYLSTVGVYGDKGGAWCDEDEPLVPATSRGGRRVAAEEAWRRVAEEAGAPLAIFRLAGIYGPGRNQLESLRAGTARRIVKPGQVFNRIHVDDIARVVQASIDRPPTDARAYNVCDDEPAPPQDVVAYAAQLLGVEAPPEIPFEAPDMSEMARSFYADNKRCRNARLKDELQVGLAYPTYREGLAALAAGLKQAR